MTEQQIAAMRQALEALETERDNYQDWDKEDGAPEYIYEAISALREALAEQPAQGCDHCNHSLYAGTKCKNCGRVTEEPAQQEPVGEIGKIVMFGGQIKEVAWKNGKMPPAGSVLYTSPPPQRKPLTEEEIIKCWGQVSGTRYGYVAFARAIEAKLKEKNT